jgi:hypothetical protein
MTTKVAKAQEEEEEEEEEGRRSFGVGPEHGQRHAQKHRLQRGWLLQPYKEGGRYPAVDAKGLQGQKTWQPHLQDLKAQRGVDTAQGSGNHRSTDLGFGPGAAQKQSPQSCSAQQQKASLSLEEFACLRPLRQEEEVIELSALRERRERIEEHGQTLRERLKEIEQRRTDREQELRLLEGVEEFLASV